MKNEDYILNKMVQTKQFFYTEPRGELISVQDILTHKLGRPVEFDEAVQYLKKQRFVYNIQSHIIRKALTKIA